MIFSLPPQFGQCSRSISKTRLRSRAPLVRAGLEGAQPGSVVARPDTSAPPSGPAGTTCARSLAAVVDEAPARHGNESDVNVGAAPARPAAA